jgi:hypothetical protein
MAISIQATESPILASLNVVSEQPGKITPYSVAGRSIIPLNLKSKCHEDNKIAEKSQALWDKAAAFIKERDAHASEISLKVLPDPNSPKRDIVVTLSYKDKEGNPKILANQALSQELLEESEKILNLIQTERTHHTTPPLELPIDKRRLLPTTLEAFVQKNMPDASLRNLLATETFIQTLQAKIAGQPELKGLQEELENIDKNAVFLAITAWGKLDTGDIDDAKRGEILAATQRAQVSAKQGLREAIEEQKKTHWIQNALSFLPLISKLPELEESDAHMYGHDVAALLIPETWAYQKHCAEAGIKDKKASIEHLVVQMMMRLEEDVEVEHPLLKGLDLSQIIKDSKEEARQVLANLGNALQI